MRPERRAAVAAFLLVAFFVLLVVGTRLRIDARPAPAPQRTSSTSMPSYCEGQVRVFPGLGVAYDPTCRPPGP